MYNVDDMQAKLNEYSTMCKELLEMREYSLSINIYDEEVDITLYATFDAFNAEIVVASSVSEYMMTKSDIWSIANKFVDLNELLLTSTYEYKSISVEDYNNLAAIYLFQLKKYNFYNITTNYYNNDIEVFLKKFLGNFQIDVLLASTAITALTPLDVYEVVLEILEEINSVTLKY